MNSHQHLAIAVLGLAMSLLSKASIDPYLS